VIVIIIIIIKGGKEEQEEAGLRSCLYSTWRSGCQLYFFFHLGPFFRFVFSFRRMRAGASTV